MSRFRLRAVVTAIVAIVLMACNPTPGFAAGPKGKIDANPNRRYPLTKRNGPWMIMVATMRDIPGREDQGLSAQQAADQMVLALRKIGIPAYTFKQSQVIDQVKLPSRSTGESVARSYIAQQGSVVVCAGNYSSSSNQTAQKTLKWIKKNFAKRIEALLTDPRAGAVYKPTPGRPSPFARAFLMPNPMLNAKELSSATRDPLLVNLNSDMEHTLMKCRGKYSLVVKTFRGKSTMHINKAALEKTAGKLDAKLGTTLDDAGMNAWRMTEALRNARSLGYDQDFEAYVYHDRHQSIVTIGSFESKNDPRIAMLVRKFRSKSRPHPKTGQPILAAELFTVPRRPKNTLPDYSWIFDPAPELIEVPTLR
ncbi:MAG: hypothetical protein AB8G99_15375 [Planctomycetaceae bacterium]